VEIIGELWRRAITAHPAPPPSVSAVAGAAALVLVLLAWPLVRLLVTVCHEAGHAVVALLAGRRLSGIRVHADTSGLTLSSGRPRGPGMVATLFAGYPAASAVGLGAAWLAGAGYAVGLLWLVVLLLAAMLLWLRNVYGAAVVVAIGALVGAFSWYATPAVAGWFADGLAWLLLLAGPRPVVEAFRARSAGTDAAQLASLTHLTRVVWIVLWLLLTVSALVLGASWMLGGLFGPGAVR
jgi:hypothetical protein